MQSTASRWFLRMFWVASACTFVLAIAVWLFAFWPQRVTNPAVTLPKGSLAIEHARIYTSPTAPVIEDGVILIKDGRIASVGTNISVPPDATTVPCAHCTVMAGFWNAHVHFTEPKWSLANWKSAATLNSQLADMLTSRGFTTVVDTGSNYLDTVPLRRRIETGELSGPHIYTAEGGLYPPHGIPFYLRESLPKWMQSFMAQPETPEQAVKEVERNLRQGADITKLFTGSYIERGTVLPMPLDIARAAVERTHQSGRLVFSHPSDLAGTRVALESGVDVLAHAPDTTEGIDSALLTQIVQHRMAMIPTLKMFATTVTHNSSYLDPIYNEVRQFHELGGTLIFGTDVGYMHDYTTDDEFAALGRCGLSASDILAMLTINPANRFGVQNEKGTITSGKIADLTILAADPFLNVNEPVGNIDFGSQNLNAFAMVETTIRSGRVIYQR